MSTCPHYDCTNRTENGYCKTTACINSKYNGLQTGVECNWKQNVRFGEWRRAEPYVDDDGIYMPVHDYVYDGVATEYKLILTKEMFQEAFKEYILKEGLLNVQSKEQENRRNSSST